MAQQLLDGAEVSAAGIGGGRESVPQCVASPAGAKQPGELLPDVVGVTVAGEPAGEGPSASERQRCQVRGQDGVDRDEASAPSFAGHQEEIAFDVVGMYLCNLGTAQSPVGGQQDHEAESRGLCSFEGVSNDGRGCRSGNGRRDPHAEQQRCGVIIAALRGVLPLEESSYRRSGGLPRVR